MTYQEAINKGKELLIQNQIYDGFGFRLMLELCDLNQINLYLEKDSEIEQSLEMEYFNKIDRLIQHEPLAYVLGFEWFYGRRFIANENVLIPREETEELIGYVLADIQDYFKQEDLVIFDVATGSGNIGITLKAELPHTTVYGSDISSEAIEVAQLNAKSLEAEVEFLVGDMGQPFIEKKLKCDVLVCNPPYIQSHEEVEKSVLDYEPHVALFGGDDGLDFYRQILDEAPQLLKERGMIAFEMGFDQRESMTKEIKERFPNAFIHFEKDLNNLDRMCFIYRGFKEVESM